MRIFILIILMLSTNIYAEDDGSFKKTQFDNWSCYFQAGVIEDIYGIDSYADNIQAERDRLYNQLCTFDYTFNLNDTLNTSTYSLRVLFPECQFTNDNQLITTKLIKIDQINNKNVITNVISSDKYRVSFLPDENNFSGAQINQDQNAKAAFFIDLIIHDKMQLNIENIGSVTINLNGIKQGLQSPYCNK